MQVGEPEDLADDAVSARAAHQSTASKAPTSVIGHAEAVMRSPVGGGSRPRWSTLFGPPISAKFAAPISPGNYRFLGAAATYRVVVCGLCRARVRVAIMTEKERSDREPFSAVPDGTISRQCANWAGHNRPTSVHTRC